MSNECWIWQGCKTKQGYGRQRVGKRTLYVHRIAYCEANGLTMDSIAGKVVRHNCDNPSCYNPGHLLVGTQRDNVHDMIERNRDDGRRGEKHHKAKLTEEDVRSIRRDDRPHVVVGKAYGVTAENVLCIRARKTWKHI